ncbi:MAG: nitroreductase family protein [Clostridia bacterium]|nr:nitroreductase family protein [Clostridia bacterium]
MSLRDLVLRNRSYRGYNSERAVSREELLSLIDLARLTPSSANLQPLRYHPAWEKEEVSAIQACTHWAASLRDVVRLPMPGQEPTAFIVICMDERGHESTTRFLRDVGIAAQTMLLGAAEMGLGGCMIGSFDREKVTALLKLPEGVTPNLVVAIGEPKENIVLTETVDGQTRYWRSPDLLTHYVPKRPLDEVLV